MTADERQQERHAIETTLAGIVEALEIVPADSDWTRCFREIRQILRCELLDLYDDEHRAAGVTG